MYIDPKDSSQYTCPFMIDQVDTIGDNDDTQKYYYRPCIGKQCMAFDVVKASDGVETGICGRI